VDRVAWVRAVLDLGGAALALFMLVRASSHVKTIWIQAAVGATALTWTFVFGAKARLTGGYIEPDLAFVAMTLGITMASNAQWALLFARTQWRDPETRPDYAAKRARNLAGWAAFGLYIPLEAAFQGAIFGINLR
jgi:hypothetical protein